MSLRRTITLWGAAALLPLTGAAGVLALAGDGEPLTADEVVERARAWAGEHTTATFEARTRVSSPDDFSFSVRSEGAVELERGFRSTDRHTGGVFTETLEAEGTLYVREADSQAELTSAKWGRYDPGARDDRHGVVPFGGAPASEVSAPLLFSPTFVRDVLAGIERPELGTRDQRGNHVVRAELDPEQAFRRLDLGIDGANVQLRVRSSGEIVRLVISAESADGELTGNFEFTRWDVPVDLAEPGPAEIDPTPALQEEALANFDDVDVVAPAALPDGWSLTYADVLSADETVEGCRQASLDFEDPADPEGSYLWLYEMPLDCAELDPPEGGQPFRAGAHVGWFDDIDDGDLSYRYGLLRVGDTAVQFETDLSPADAAIVLSELRPLAFPFEARQLTGVGQSRRA